MDGGTIVGSGSGGGAVVTAPRASSPRETKTMANASTRAAYEEEPDLSTISWRYELWINTYPLNRATVLDYFKHSQFYGVLLRCTCMLLH